MTELLLRRKIHALTSALSRNPAFIALDQINHPSWAALACTYGLKELSGDHISAAFGNHFDMRPLPLSQILTEAKVA
ncbi:hypothetical protein [uncultured Brevundimonas sp.]|uniref:hypothetical protein n=1 Tax=uncultured Brevundimonas sp. TaxID=213418 RepID=UPI00262EA0C9|nr:hypothetical protein [uncultured Brevundimonas sp.]